MSVPVQLESSVISGPTGCCGVTVSVMTMIPVAATPFFSPAVVAAAALSQVNGLWHLSRVSKIGST